MPPKKKQLEPAKAQPIASESMFDTSSSEEEENRPPEDDEPARKRRKTWKSSGLTFPPNIFYNALKEGHYASKFQRESGVAMAGVLQYLVTEMTEIAVECARSNNKNRIAPRHIMMATARDADFAKLLEGVVFPSSGVMPHIEEVLLPSPTVRPKKRRSNMPGPSGVAAKKKKKNLLAEQANHDSDSD